MDELDKFRQKINNIDKQIEQLLNQRFEMSKYIALYKKYHQQPIYVKQREQQLLEQLLSKKNLIFPVGHIYLKQQLMMMSRLYQYQFIDIPDITVSTSRYQKIGHIATLKYDEHYHIAYESNETLIQALIKNKIDIALTTLPLDNISTINYINAQHLYIVGYSQYQQQNVLHLAKTLAIPSTLRYLGIIITLKNSQDLSQMINICQFYDIKIQQLFFLSENQLFIHLTGHLNQSTIKRLTYILNNEQHTVKIILAY